MEKVSQIANGGVLDRATAGLKTIVPQKPSRAVRLTDVPKVLWDAMRIKFAMLAPFPGKYEKAASISHCQIEAKDPLRFFVVDKEFAWHFGYGKLLPARIVMNPVIVSHSEGLQREKEGCMSFPFQRSVKLLRWEVVEAEYWTFFGKRRKKFYLFRAAMVQHEIDHMNAINIYDTDRKAKRSFAALVRSEERSQGN